MALGAFDDVHEKSDPRMRQARLTHLDPAPLRVLSRLRISTECCSSADSWISFGTLVAKKDNIARI